MSESSATKKRVAPPDWIPHMDDGDTSHRGDQYYTASWPHFALPLTLPRHIVDHCCYAWNKRIGKPWKIMSIGMREWAHSG